MQATRRIFLGSATAASAARVLGAADRIRIGVIGTGGRGQWLMKALQRIAGDEIQIVAVCDVYDARRNEAARIAPGAEQYLDYRQLLARKDVDAVIVATPDHWHAAMTVEAMRAGKDVYVEKPMVHYPRDGQAIVRTARATGRIVQVGTQGRGLPNFVEAKQRYIDTGVMGKVGLARTWYTSNTGYIRTPPPGFERKPEGLDWDRWLGPGPKIPWNPDVYFSPYKWRHYMGGMIMGIAIHVVDSAHHWLSLRKPLAAVAGGGVYHYKDGRDTPDVVSFILEYPEELVVTFTAECLSAPGVRTSAGVELRGTGGVLWAERYIQDYGYIYTPNTKVSREPAAAVRFQPANAEKILRDWLDRIRDCKRTICNEEVAYYSTVACYMAMEALRTRSRVTWDRRWDLPS
ncbi:MAG: Gfo/Idh/MocA family oxidoreductase [Bryobacterales bacterium]|nr:Gfo/Idh/MocA family oxidoreductase [Bryobacteraceae bacterium]MDW8129142.1 Gfo/Idh/MocA family oxidoreductase [Bryobacterales bacterium]